MPLTVEQFSERLTSSGVMSADELREWLAGLPADNSPADGEQLASELVLQKKLTKFQAEQICLGHGASLTLGNYVILDKLGQGGMGMVLKAQHKRMKRLVALKVMSPSAVKTPDALKRFHREVEAAAKLRHPNIVAADDADEAKGTHFLVMEYVEGSDLSAFVKKNGPFPVEHAVRCIIQAARGLEFAHEQGVIHRDIKPANLLLDTKGTVKILDMGLARIEDSVGGSSEGAGLTSTGAIMGTVDYMSPEQAMDTKQADARSDIYSLGCSLYYLLTGRSLFDGDTMMKKLIGHREGAIPDLEGSPVAPRQESRTSVDAGLLPASPGVDGTSAFVSRGDTAALKGLNAVFRRMVAKKSQDRQQSMTEVIADLERCLSGGSATSVIERSSNSATNVSVSSTGGTTNDLKDFLRQVAGSESPTVSAVQGSGTAVSASSVDAPTMISTSSDALTNPGTVKTQLFDQASRPIATKDPAVPSQPSNSRMKLFIGSVATIAVVLLAVIFAMKGEPKKDRKQEIASTTNRETGVAAAPANTPTPYEILTSDEYEWTPPENLGPAVNAPASEKFPALSGDGLRLIFFSHARADHGLSEAVRSRIDEPFDVAKPLGEDFSHGVVNAGIGLSADGLVLVFASGRLGGPGEPGNMNLWQATRADLSTPFSKPVGLTTLNTEGNDEHPWLSADGLTIRFQSSRLGGHHWMSQRASRDAEFAAPTQVEYPLFPGVANYSGIAGHTLSSDERVLIFAPGYHDHETNREVQKLLMSVRPSRDAKFGTPVDLGPVVNGEFAGEYPTLSSYGTTLVFTSSRPGGIGQFPDSDMWITRRVRKNPAGEVAGNDGIKPEIKRFRVDQAKRYQEVWAKKLGVPVEKIITLPGGETLEMMLIPPGEFVRSEGDQFLTRLTKPFYLGKYEVTQAQWQAVMGTNPSKFKETPAHPVERVCWEDIQPFLRKLNEKQASKTTFSLPTEAQWEYACRAGSWTSYWFGNNVDELASHDWFADNSGGKTHPVGQLKPNPFGLYDIHGNVVEFCADWHQPGYYAQAPKDDPPGPPDGVNRVARSAGWEAAAVHCMSGARHSFPPTPRYEYIGFRLAASVDVIGVSRETKAIPANNPNRAPAPAVAPFDAKQARSHQEAWAYHLGVPVEYTNSIGMKFRLIPPGKFQMGSGKEHVQQASDWINQAKLSADAFERSRILEEGPQHPVTISKPFCLGEVEVTVGQFRAFVDATKYLTQGEQFGGGNSNTWSPNPNVKPDQVKLTWRTPGYATTDHHPVTQVTWADCIAFCNWLSEIERLKPCYSGNQKDGWTYVPGSSGYRLPTEAEWEYSCRAGTTSQFSFGDDPVKLAEYGWFERALTGAPQPGGQKLPNPFGLFDLHGNVREWCYDWYSSEYYASSPAVDPVGPDAGSDRVMRGGRIGRKAIECRSAFRYDIAPFLRNTDGGFRVVRSLPPTVTDLVLAPGTVWSAPEVAGPELNSSREDASPFVSEDGLSLLFASKRPLGHVGYEIWESRRSSLSEPFGQPKELPRIVNSIGDDDSPWLSADGCELFFASNRPGSNGQRDLYICRRNTPDAKWEAPVNLGEAINTTDNEDCPVLADNGLTLYFSSNRPGGQGGMDVYQARRPAINAPFEASVNLGTVVNSSQDEMNFAPLRDGRSALFARQNANQSTVMAVRTNPQDGSFGQLQPVELGQVKGTIKAPRLSHDGSTLYFHASLPQGAGAFDLWKVRRVQNSSRADDAVRPPAASSLQFDGSGARVEIPSLVMEPTKPIAIEVWARPSKPVTHGVVAGFAGQCVLRLRARQWWFGVRDKDSKIHEVVASADVDWNKPAHVAGVFDGTHVRLFVDGIRQGEPVPCSSVVAVNWMATLGAAFDGTDSFAGEISQARFSQIARYVDDFNPPARFTSDKDTIALYLFHEGSGTSLKDDSGHMHSGKIVNAKWLSSGPDKKMSAQPASSGANPDRAAAEWVIARGGEVAVTGRQGLVANVNDLPAEKFEVQQIKFKRRLIGEDADLIPLRELNHLVFVGIDYTHPTPAGITALGRLPKLERVSCGGQPLSDDQVTALTRMEKITSLYLAGAQLKPAQCAILAGSMAQIGSLNLMNNPLLDDAALAPLGGMSKLAKLQLQGTKVTAAGVAALKKSLPNCAIEWDETDRSK